MPAGSIEAVDPSLDRERGAVVYREAFPRVYRALVAALFDRGAALDGLHDAFEEGLRSPPPDQRPSTAGCIAWPCARHDVRGGGRLDASGWSSRPRSPIHQNA